MSHRAVATWINLSEANPHLPRCVGRNERSGKDPNFDTVTVHDPQQSCPLKAGTPHNEYWWLGMVGRCQDDFFEWTCHLQSLLTHSFYHHLPTLICSAFSNPPTQQPCQTLPHLIHLYHSTTQTSAWAHTALYQIVWCQS